ncbi:unnamed protein product [Amoebophrya sp. A25]|nr:unnamed protein product [Amoebophrya sp. A25]|eukprot:GSA25T00001510001.1
MNVSATLREQQLRLQKLQDWDNFENFFETNGVRPEKLPREVRQRMAEGASAGGAVGGNVRRERSRSRSRRRGGPDAGYEIVVTADARTTYTISVRSAQTLSELVPKIAAIAYGSSVEVTKDALEEFKRDYAGLVGGRRLQWGVNNYKISPQSSIASVCWDVPSANLRKDTLFLCCT